MKNKYFKQTVVAELNRLRTKINIPSDFYEFYTENAIQPFIYDLKPAQFKNIGMGIELNGRCFIFNSMLNHDEIKTEIKYNLERNIRTFGLLKFANNEYAEGGFYIGVSSENFGNVFYYKNYVDWAKVEDVVMLASSFFQFIKLLKPIGINFSEYGTVYSWLEEEINEDGEVIKLKV